MTYGSLSYLTAERKWEVRCSPHVAIKLKRIFAKIDTSQHGRFLLSDTLDNCRDLLWFMQRFPLEIKSGMVRLHRGAQDHHEQVSLVERLLSRQLPAQAFELALPAREYQRVAAAVYLAKGGLLLADDVGVGKTITAICTFTDPRTRPALVVAPIQVLRQWRDQINRFAPHLTTHIVKKGKPYDITDRSRNRKQMAFPAHFPDVVIMNYHKLSGWAEHIAPLVKSVVYDECQELRRRGTPQDPSEKYHAAAHISSLVPYRLGMSATPIYNYGEEIFNVLDCIFPDAMGTEGEFKNEWCRGPFITEPAAFGEYMRESGIMLRRTRAEVGRELPELTKVPHTIDADLSELEKVAGSAAELAQTILKQNEQFRGEKMQASEMLSNLLRQATGIAKAPYVAEFVRLLVENGEPVLLAGWHREVYSIWLEKLADLKPVMYTGSESDVRKEESKRAFVAGESPIMIMSLRSGAGVDGLQGVCRTVVFGELDWSPGVHEQFVGRIHRDGQGDKVLAYFLIATSGADPVMAETLGLKKQQIDGIRNEDQTELVSKLQTDGGHIRRLAESYLKKTKSSTTETTEEHGEKAAEARA